MAESATFMLSSFSTFFFASSSFPSYSISSKLSFLPMRHFHRTPSFTRVLRVCALSSNDIKVGTSIEVDGAPWRVLEFLHVRPGKEAAFVRTKMRNHITGNTVGKTFRAGSSIAVLRISELRQQRVRRTD